MDMVDGGDEPYLREKAVVMIVTVGEEMDGITSMRPNHHASTLIPIDSSPNLNHPTIDKLERN